jgi:hypothetical protein
MSQSWWYMSIIPVLGRLKKEDCEFEASLGLYNETLFQIFPSPQRKKQKPQPNTPHIKQLTHWRNWEELQMEQIYKLVL